MNEWRMYEWANEFYQLINKVITNWWKNNGIMIELINH